MTALPAREPEQWSANGTRVYDVAGLVATIAFRPRNKDEAEITALIAQAPTLERALARQREVNAGLVAALERLASMQAFEGPRMVTEHDAELIARINYAEEALKARGPA